MREIGFKRALLINDLAALALAVDLLEEKQLHAIGPQINGAVAGDLALAHGARGGVYIAGGIAEKIEEFLIQSPFRRRFENKGRLRPDRAPCSHLPRQSRARSCKVAPIRMGASIRGWPTLSSRR